MNFFLLCVFTLVPFQNVTDQEVCSVNCLDFMQIQRFQNELARYQPPAPASEIETAPILADQLEPEVVPEHTTKQEEQIAESSQTEEPALMEIPDEIPAIPVFRDETVEPTSAEELIPAVQPLSVPVAAPVASNIPEVTPNDEPIRRPWGVLTFFIFLLLLSVSVNVFLGWQLVEVRKAKLK